MLRRMHFFPIKHSWITCFPMAWTRILSSAGLMAGAILRVGAVSVEVLQVAGNAVRTARLRMSRGD